jgi:hypothetical protein
MMSEVDPSLELQQLASQAIQYQATQLQEQQQQLDQHQPQQYSSPVEYDADGNFFCPFASCNRLYKRKDLLKRHLTTLSASPDEHHQEQAVWDHVRDSGVMTVHTRPRNLSEDQKKQRRKESNLRHRVKYAQELKEKRNRKRRVEKLMEGKQVGVQTPDWEAEARAAAMNIGAPTAIQGVEPQPVVIEVQTTRGRRSGKKQ